MMLSRPLRGISAVVVLLFVQVVPSSGADRKLATNAIAPGEGIGGVQLGASLEDIEKGLGKSQGDLALGRLWEKWTLPEGGELEVFCRRPDEHHFHVLKIRTTSRQYVTSDGLHVGSTLPEIQKSYPTAQWGEIQSSFRSGNQILKVTGKGIIFEFPNRRPDAHCVAIQVEDRE